MFGAQLARKNRPSIWRDGFLLVIVPVVPVENAGKGVKAAVRMRVTESARIETPVPIAI